MVQRTLSRTVFMGASNHAAGAAAVKVTGNGVELGVDATVSFKSVQVVSYGVVVAICWRAAVALHRWMAFSVEGKLGLLEVAK